jgi:hypothetical protein
VHLCAEWVYSGAWQGFCMSQSMLVLTALHYALITATTALCMASIYPLPLLHLTLLCHNPPSSKLPPPLQPH